MMAELGESAERKEARAEAEGKLEAERDRRDRLEKELEEVRDRISDRIRECVELGTRKTAVADIAGVPRSWVYVVLAEGEQ